MQKKPLVTALLLLGFISTADAAQSINLRTQPNLLRTYLSTNAVNTNAISMQMLNTETDAQGTQHVRMQETYQGVPVWGGDVVAHYAKTSRLSAANAFTANGQLYQNLREDLNTQRTIYNERTALQLFTDAFLKQNPAAQLSNQQSKRIVYIDANQKAQWGYYVQFKALSSREISKPTAIINATTGVVFNQWNDLHTEAPQLEDVKGGGIGGNPDVGKVQYDNLPGDMEALTFQRDVKKKICYLQNAETKVVDTRTNKTPSFACEKPDANHNNIYWNTQSDASNGGYSPDDDGVYSHTIVDQMYQTWFGIPILTKNNQPMLVTMYVHDDSLGQNAYWENESMHFGEGDDESYPVVAPSVVAHELSHGFTEQHSGLVYSGQSGGLNEAYSDMADKAVEYFVYGKNNWEIDPELLKPGGRLLRWMDKPSTDCGSKKPGSRCSIDNASQYYSGLDVHYSSGVFNRAFTILAGHWNTQKAFEVMADANRYYWTSQVSFNEAACGVISATKARGYDVASVQDAMQQVGVSTAGC